ncbi:hypothetical protein GOP47_0012515 [Adiantum capillus-veneris]|uniref:Transcription-repair-coupling factor n=1 Tax=Adiantum capillus-veneris TaxID=13818 RepID=A0A9D4UQU1_ADICA|nr:hypothetical protein GOP47_0012515 [Adiantum capillus-veneris]
MKARRLSLRLKKFTCLVHSMQAQQIGTLSRDAPTFLDSTSSLEEIFSRVESAPPTQASAGPDPFADLHHLLEKEIELGVSTHRGVFSKDETNLALQKLKDTRKQRMGMINTRRKLAGDKLLQDFTYSLDPESLVPGEYVVHKSKGIGRFVRLNKEDAEGPEYVILQYADGMAKLKSSQAAQLLYRYRQPGDKGRAPGLSKLSDPRPWEKRKSKSKLAAQKMVVDLLQLYVNRLKQKRQPYAKDGEEMEGFVSKFPYEPTPDQKRAFADVEDDMLNRETPMDRLICGDVGFGKTEVALRAIFRVFLAGKQVMVLAPTTVLARQHYNVICERFADYNARIALLSKFQTRAERKRLAIEIKAGNLDIIVGTHALFNSNIHYNNLGILVVDEEQRFGVKQKERITSMKNSVDVLTLSATPIPRTLYLALAGFRDASLITTPPPQRLPIVTHLLEFDEEQIIAAINYEIARNGQVYYVLPRSQGLPAKKAALQRLFPSIEIGIAYGKQSATLLEETMDRFAQGESQLLLCTNIIESGLDIRRVNTIIVEDIHLFGLAQIYQLRGRVGRADKEAHAYLFYPQKESLSDEALERLVAIEECCDLGQGFKLAERDLAIRGFGSVFGERQSGEAAHIGLDLFFDLLFETMSKADSHIFFQYDFKKVKLDVDFDPVRAVDYIKDAQRYETVISELEVAACSGLRELMYFTTNLRFEFGRETTCFEVLLQAVYIRRIAADVGIHHIWVQGKTIVMESDMSETVFNILKEGITSESLLSSMTFKQGIIEIELLIKLSQTRLIGRIFASMVELRKGLSHFARQ